MLTLYAQSQDVRRREWGVGEARLHRRSLQQEAEGILGANLVNILCKH